MPTLSSYIEDIAPTDRSAPGQVLDLNVAKEVRVAVVGPKGQFNVIRTGPNQQGSTAGVVFWSNEMQVPVIPPRFQAIQDDGMPAFIFFREGCQRNDSMEFYERWKAIDNEQQECRARSLPLPRFTNVKPEDIYPAWVMARRNQYSGGRREVDMTKFLATKVKSASKVGGTAHIELDLPDGVE